MKAKIIIEINSRGNLQREMEIKRDSYLEQIFAVNTTKTKAGERTIPMLPNVDK